MNETFKTFIRQVKGETYSPIGLSTIYGMQKMYGMSELELQNFAELIVTECISTCERLQDDLDRQNWPTPYGCAEAIKEHFGVEEERKLLGF